MGRKYALPTNEEIEETQNREAQYFYPLNDGANQALDTGSIYTDSGYKRAGMENEDEGIGNIFMEGLISGSKNIAGSLATTFGNTEYGALMEADVQQNLDYDQKDLRFDSMSGFFGTVGDWTASSLGNAVPDIAGAVGAGMVTGGLGAGAMLGTSTFSFARMQGANFRMIRKWKPDADIRDVQAASAVLSITQAAIEQMGGLESGLSTKLMRKKTVSSVMREVTEKAGTEGILSPIAKIIGSSKNRAVAFGTGAGSEMIEESLQGAAEIITGINFGDQEYSSEDLLQALVIEPMRALPAGGFMGGAFYTANATGKAATGMPEVNDGVRNAVFSVQDSDGNIYVDSKAMAEDDQAFSELNNMLRSHFGADSQAVTDQIKSLAYAMSVSAQANYGEVLVPKDFINDLQVAFVESSPTSEDIAAIGAIRSNGTLDNSQKGDEILSYIDNKFGKKSSIYNAIKSVGQNVEASGIARSSNEMIDQYKRYAPKLETEQMTAWTSGITEQIISSQGLDIQATLMPTIKSPNTITYNQSAEMFSREDVARIFIENPVVEINKVKYAMDADETGITFTEATVFDETRSWVRDEYLKQVMDERKHPVATGGDVTLAREKMLHAVVESKYIVGDVLAAYDDRLGSTAYDNKKSNANREIEGQANDTRQAIDITSKRRMQYEQKQASDTEAKRQANQRIIDKMKSDDALKPVDELIAEFREIEQELKKEDVDEKVANPQGLDPQLISLAAPMMEKLSSSKSPAELIYLTNELSKLYDSFGQKFRLKDQLSEDAVRFEVEELELSEAPVSEMSESQIKDEAKKLGVSFVEFSKAGGHPIFYDAATDMKFAAMDDDVMYKVLNDHRKMWGDTSMPTMAQLKMSDKTMGEMTEIEMTREADRAGLEFVEMHDDGFAVFYDPMLDMKVGAMEGDVLYKVFKNHRATWGDSVPTLSGAMLTEFAPGSSTINGMYITAQRTAFFFKNAGMQTVVHEFAHHAKSLLPVEMQADILGLFNESTGRTEIAWTVEADEWFANTMTKWIVEKEMPNATPTQLQGLNRARAVVFSAYKDFDLSDDTKVALDELYGELPTQELVVGASEALRSMMKQDGVTISQLNDLVAGRGGERFNSKDDTIRPFDGNIDDSVRYDLNSSALNETQILSSDERKNIYRQLHAILGDHQAVNESLNQTYGISSLKDASDDELIRMIDRLKTNSRTGDANVESKATMTGQKILDWTRKTFSKMQSERNASSDSKGAKLLSGMVNKIRKGGVMAMITTSSLESMMKILDDFNDSGVWHSTVDAPVRMAREQSARIYKKYQERFSALISESGTDMANVQKQTHSIDGLDYTGGEVAYLAVINRMREQDQKSFVESNYADNEQAGYDVMRAADKIAMADEGLTGLIDSTQKIYQELWIELNEVYERVTGRKMGKLNWYLPFVRMNEWDDLDQTLSALNSVDGRGNEYYRSATKNMQSRSGNKGSRIDITDPFGATSRYIRQATTYIATAETVKQISATLATDEVKASLRWKYGEGSANSKASWSHVHNIVSDLVRGEMYYDARIRPMSESEMHLKRFRTSFTLFALAGNVSTSMKQILSAPLGVARSGMPLHTSTRAVAEIFSIAPKAFVNALSNTKKFITGNRNSEPYSHILHGTNVYDNWEKHSNVLLNRHGNPETGEAMNYNFNGLMGIKIGGIPLGEALMAGISAVDAVTVGTLWNATYESWVRNNIEKKGMSTEEAMTDAADKANRMISDTQPPSLPQERNLIQRGDERIKTAFMFTGATMRQYEVFVTDVAGRLYKAVKGVQKDGIGSLKEVLFHGSELQSGLLIQMGIGFVIPAVMFGMMTRRREPTEKELLYDIMSYPFAAMPFSKGLIGASLGIETYDGGEINSYVQSAFKEVYDGIEATSRAFYGEGWTGDNITDTVDALSLFSSTPRTFSRIVSAAAINATGENDFLAELREGYVDPLDETKEF